MTAGAHSSPFSAESNFRELDDVFLQTQTRIWLGAVLQTRFDDSLQDVSDLLADGELLFQVSRVVWKMLLTRFVELSYSKAYKYEPFAYRKSSRRYMPYSNVDTFLKICKILGLTGIDLFSPSDVVEKKNTRKVCMCIRLLSKKARSKQLNVPDFDIVTYSVTMPTDMVGFIRRSLEQSQHKFLASHNLNQGLMENCRKKIFVGGFNRNYGLHSEESDDSEYNSMIHSDGSLINFSNVASSQMNYDFADSPGLFSVNEKFTAEQQFSELEVQSWEQNECTSQFGSPCLNESPRSCWSLLGENNFHLGGLPSSACVYSPIHLSDRVSHVKAGCRRSHESSSLEFSYCDLDKQNDILEVSTGGRTEEQTYVSTPFSNVVCHEKGTDDPFHFDGDDSAFRGYTSPSSHGSNSTPRIIEDGYGSRISDVNNMEATTTSANCSVSGVASNLDFNQLLDAEHDVKTVWLPEFKNHKADKKSQDIVKYDMLVHHSTPNTEKPPLDVEVIDVGSTNKSVSDTQCTRNYSDKGILYNINGISTAPDTNVEIDEGKLSQIESNFLKNVHSDHCLELLLCQSYSPFDFPLWDQKGKCAVAITPNEIGKNDGNETSSFPLVSPEDLQVETAYSSPAKAVADASVHKDVTCGVIDDDTQVVESDEQNNHFHTALSNNILKIKYENLKASAKLSSRNDGCSFQHQDIMVLDHNIDQSEASVDNFVHPSNSNESTPDSECAENTNKVDCQSNRKHEGLEAKDSNRTHDPSAQLARGNPPRRLLMSIVKGTAVVGLVFALLQIGKNGKEKIVESNMQREKIRKEHKGKLPLQKGLEGVNRVYPSNKLGIVQ